MTTPDAVAVVIAALAAFWAALLALAEESPKVSRALVEGPRTDSGSPTPYRVVHASRLSLLFIAAVSAANAGAWWERAAAESAGVIFVSVGFIFMIGEALPRAIGALAPEVAAAAAPVAERTTAVFHPLAALVGWRVQAIYTRHDDFAERAKTHKPMSVPLFVDPDQVDYRTRFNFTFDPADALAEFQEAANQAQAKLIKLFRETIKIYGAEKGYTVILEASTLYYSSNTINVTDALLTRFNADTSAAASK